jgi:hypothetical protein
MTWDVKVVEEDRMHRVQVTCSSWLEDNTLLNTQATALANQLLIASAECARLNNPSKKFWQ